MTAQLHVVVVVLDAEGFQLKVVHRAAHMPAEAAFETDAAQAIGKIADGGHGDDGTVRNVRIQADFVDEVGVIGNGSVHDKAAQVGVRVVALQVQAVDGDVFLAHLYALGRCHANAETGAGFPGDETLHFAGDEVVFDGQVAGYQVFHVHGEIVPVDGPLCIEEAVCKHVQRVFNAGVAEGEIAYFHVFGADKIAPPRRLLALLGLDAEYAVQVHGGADGALLVRFDGKVEHAAVQFEAPHMHAAVPEQAHEVEFDRQVVYAAQCIHAAHYRRRVFQDNIVEDDGVEGAQGNQADIQVCVYPVPQALHHLVGDEGLHPRRLNGHEPCQDEQEEQAQQPCQYFDDASH